MAATAGTVQSSRGHLSMDVSDSHIDDAFVQSDWSLPIYINIYLLIKKTCVQTWTWTKNISFTTIESIE